MRRMWPLLALLLTVSARAGTLESLDVRREGQRFFIDFVTRVERPIDVMREIVGRFELLPLVTPMVDSVWTEAESPDDPEPTLHMMVHPCVFVFCWWLRKSSRVTVSDNQINLQGTAQGSYRYAVESLSLIDDGGAATRLHYVGELELKERVPEWISAGITRWVAEMQIKRGLPKLEEQVDRYLAGTLVLPAREESRPVKAKRLEIEPKNP